MRTFPIGGIHPHDNKEWSKDKAIEVLELPDEVTVIPFSAEKGEGKQQLLDLILSYSEGTVG